MRGIEILEDLRVRAIDVKLEIAEARGGEVLEIRNRSQTIGLRRFHERGHRG